MKYFLKTHKDFSTKREYHEYLKNGLYELLKTKIPDIHFVREYPPGEPSGIDIVGLRKVVGVEREIMAVEVLGVAEENVEKHLVIRSGQVEKIMHDISKLLFRSNAPLRALVFSTVEVRDFMRRMKERNMQRGYVNWQQIEFYEVNEFLEKL